MRRGGSQGFEDKPLTTEQEEYPESDDDKSADKSILSGEDRTNQEPPKNHAKYTRDRVRIFLEDTVWSRVWSHKNRELLCDPRVWIEAIALVTVICYTRYAGQQSDAVNNTLIEVRKQTGYAKDSAKGAVSAAKSAQEAVSLARSNFIVDQRPYVLTNGIIPEANTARDQNGHFSVGQRVFWNFYYSNYGRSPAVNFTIRSRLFHGPGAMHDASRWLMSLPHPLKPGSANGTLPPGGPPPSQPGQPQPGVGVGQGFSSVHSLLPLTKENVDYIFGHDWSIVVIGRLQYRDLPGNLYWTDFCASIFLTGAINLCPEHNEIH